MDALSQAELDKYRAEYRDNDEATRWAMLRSMLNGLDRRIEAAGSAAGDAHKAAVLAGDIAKEAIEAAERTLGARIDQLTTEVHTLADEAKTIANGVNRIDQNIGGVLELAESALTMAGSAQRALSKVAGNYEESARAPTDSKGSRPSSPG